METLFWIFTSFPIRVPGITTTFWPRLHRSPITAPGMTWQKCQIRVPGPITAPSSMKEDGWAKYSDMEELSPARDRFHLGLQGDAEPGVDRVASPGDQRPHVARSGAAGVDEVVRVHRGDHRPAQPGLLEPRRLDQASGGPRPVPPRRRRRIGILEHTPAAGLIERRPLLAPGEQLLHLGIELGGVTGPPDPLRLQHDVAVEPAVPVAEGDLLRGEAPLVPGAVHHRDPLHDVGPLSAVAPRVHEHPSAHRPGDADHHVDPGPSLLGRLPGRQRRGEPGPEPPPGPVAPHPDRKSTRLNYSPGYIS